MTQSLTNTVRLNEEDWKIAELLTEVGVSRNVARTIAYLSKRDESQSVDIENGADLRQPEVSLAIQRLRDRNWISERKIKKEGKGRPTHTYKINTNLETIINTLIQEKKNALTSIERDLINLINEKSA
jgi:predicted transcriptional regulator